MNKLLGGSREKFFVPPTLPAPNLPCSCILFFYLHRLLTLGDPRRNYCLLANYLPTKRLCWSTLVGCIGETIGH